MEVASIRRMQLCRAAVPFVLAACQVDGVTRIALLGSFLAGKKAPEGIELLVTVEDSADLTPLATAGRQLRGRVTSLTQGDAGAEIYVASPTHRYLGRLCFWRECWPGRRMRCEARHCGQRPYLYDDLQNITLEHMQLVAPPLEVWPAILTRVAIPIDVEEILLHPLLQQLKLERTDQIIPREAYPSLVKTRGKGSETVDQAVFVALQAAATFLAVSLTEETPCNVIELHPLKRYAPLLNLADLHLTKLWAVELKGKTCLVAQGVKEGEVVYIAK